VCIRIFFSFSRRLFQSVPLSSSSAQAQTVAGSPGEYLNAVVETP
jgi:hypothetical protein